MPRVVAHREERGLVDRVVVAAKMPVKPLFVLERVLAARPALGHHPLFVPIRHDVVVVHAFERRVVFPDEPRDDLHRLLVVGAAEKRPLVLELVRDLLRGRHVVQPRKRGKRLVALVTMAPRARVPRLHVERHPFAVLNAACRKHLVHASAQMLKERRIGREVFGTHLALGEARVGVAARNRVAHPKLPRNLLREPGLAAHPEVAEPPGEDVLHRTPLVERGKLLLPGGARAAMKRAPERPEAGRLVRLRRGVRDRVVQEVAVVVVPAEHEEVLRALKTLWQASERHLH